MALLYLKKLVLGSRERSSSSPEMRYSRIDTSNSFDLEQASFLSHSSSTTSDRESLDEKHTTSGRSTFCIKNLISPRTLSDFTIGLSDGLTVPFALTAGLSALGDARVVVFGGLAELVAGAISMGVAGYLGAKGEREAQKTVVAETTKTLNDNPQEALKQIRDQFESFEFPGNILDIITTHYSHMPREELLPHLLRFQSIDQDPSSQHNPYLCGFVISFAYFFGGFIPLLPYMFSNTVESAFYISVGVTAIVLFTFGFAKTAIVCDRRLLKCFKGGAEMFILGGVAAAAAVICVRTLNSN